MKSNVWLLTVNWRFLPKTTYIFDDLYVALKNAFYVRKRHKKIRMTLVRKELTKEQCEAVLSTGQLPT